MKIKQIFTLLLAISWCQFTFADNEVPTIQPTATYTNSEGEEESSTNYSGPAPLKGVFKANPENVGNYTATYEWRFTLENEETPYLVRYEEDTEYTFNTAGTHKIVLWATFTSGDDVISYGQEYWDELGAMTVTVSESVLEMPNAFSPNGDGKNDVFRAKKYQSLVEFKATIYNRYGQKIYEWDNPADGWDGTFHGKDAKQGVYFVYVRAKGADGREYKIRRDVNLLRGYSLESTTTAGE